MNETSYDDILRILDEAALADILKDFKPKVALVLGSGLGGLMKSAKETGSVAYEDVSGMPVSTVSGHAGRFRFGYIENVPFVLMDGRVHIYEGYSAAQTVLPIRLMKLMGADTLVLTNASGGINMDAGDFMVIKDHISFFVPSPLIGKNDEAFGARFPDMSNVYDKALTELIYGKAKELGIKAKKGVYAQLTGPNYETPSEIRALKLLGADAVGMSTATEAMVGAHMGMKVCGVSLITNKAADPNLNHKEVIASGAENAKKMASLIESIIKEL